MDVQQQINDLNSSRRHGNCLVSPKCHFSADLDNQICVFPGSDPALTMVCLIQYTCQPLTYDKTAIFRSEKIVLPKWQNAVSTPDHGFIT
jgi:hypothetical protein